LCYFLRSHLGQLQFDRWFSGSSGQIHIYEDDVNQFIVPSPDATGVPFGKQHVITDEITQQLEVAYDLERQAEEKRLDAIRIFDDGIMKILKNIKAK